MLKRITIRVEGIDYSLLLREAVGEPAGSPLVFLHGMTLSAREWRPVIEQLPKNRTIVVPDLIGHGQSEAPEEPGPYQLTQVLSFLHELLDTVNITSAHWVGYSMGGRILLHFALAYPRRVSTVLLESSTAGLRGKEQRRNRRDRDQTLADFLRDNPLEQFVDRWLDAPILNTQKSLPKRSQEWVRNIRLGGHPEGLRRCLVHLGRGEIEPVWDRLSDVDLPVCLVTGERDEKHIRIHEEVAEKLPDVCKKTVKGVGHNLHFEAPERYISILKEWLSS